MSHFFPVDVVVVVVAAVSLSNSTLTLAPRASNSFTLTHSQTARRAGARSSCGSCRRRF